MDAPKTMKKIGMQISVLMGVTLSFFLSLTGNALSKHFTVKAWLVSFAISTLVSLAIGFCVPMKPLLDAVTRTFGLRQGRFGARCVESLVSDIIYTPLITLIMVALAYFGARREILTAAMSHGASEEVAAQAAAQLHFLPMFLHSLAVEMLVGYVLIFIFMPLFMRLVMKAHRADVPPQGMPTGQSQ